MDQYQGALADLTLSADPLTQNRYNLAGSNPLSAVEYDGHKLALDDGAGGGAAPVQVDPKKIMVTIPAPHGQCTYTDPTGCERAAPGTHAQTVSLYDLMHPKGPKNYCGWASFACTLVGINQTLNCFHGGGVGSCVGAVFAVGTDIFVVGKGAKLLSLASAGKAGSSLAAEAAGGPHLALGLTRTSAGPKALEQFAAERGAVTWTDPAFADIWGGAQAARPENVQLMIDRVVQSGGRISFNLTDIRDVEGIVSGRTVGLPPSQLTPCL